MSGMLVLPFRYFPGRGYSLRSRAGEESPDTTEQDSFRKDGRVG